jgi:hypothetical protein
MSVQFRGPARHSSFVQAPDPHRCMQPYNPCRRFGGQRSEGRNANCWRKPMRHGFGVPIFHMLAAMTATGSLIVYAQTPAREDVVAKLGLSIRAFVGNLSSVVAEEDYYQEVSSPPRKRTLKSDFLLVRYPGTDRLWLSFRDVREVDGRPVGEGRDERLSALFLQPFEDATRRAREISLASDRYDIARVAPLDDPLLALTLLQVTYQKRFRFAVRGIDRNAGPTVRLLEFQEVQRPSIVRLGINDVMTRGLVWIDESSGRIVKTELRAGSGTFPIRVVTVFAFDESVGADVPSEMQGWYPGPDHNVTTTVKYKRYRRFQVHTVETIR